MTQIADTAEVLRAMLRHESEQADRRVSWLGMFQGLLFAALAFAWDKAPSLINLVAIVGCCVAVLVFCGTLAGTFAIERIRGQWRRLIPEDYNGADPMGFYPDRAPWSVYLSPENLLPVVFAIAWMWVLVAR